MLFALPSLAFTMLSAAASGLSDGLADVPRQSGNAPITPQDPSTLVLALIGVGTIAAYLAVKWRAARAEIPIWTGRLSDQSETRQLVDVADEMPSRGAA